MSGLPAPFSGMQAFRDAFALGLAEGVLAKDDPGCYILALANASSDPVLGERLTPRLRAEHARWMRRLEDVGAQGLDAAPDDVAVLQQMAAVDMSVPETPARRAVGPWELVFNPVRALRPARMSAARIDCLQAPFNEKGFHFNKDFLRAEILWEGDLLGDRVRLLYNKFPFADLHCLLVREPARCRPQYLGAEDHRAAWAYCEALGGHLPGWGMAYNAYGAYASVNHQHFQSYVRDDAGYPVERACWRHNGGERPYPLACEVYADREAAWQRISGLHASNIPYNLLYRPGRLYLLPRAFQGTSSPADWTGGFAWSECVGAVTLTSATAFRTLTESAIEKEFRKLRP